MIADVISFNKKCDRENSGIKRRVSVLQGSLASERVNTAENELKKLTKLEENFAEVYTLLRFFSKGGKLFQCAGATGQSHTYYYYDQWWELERWIVLLLNRRWNITLLERWSPEQVH